MRLLARHLHLLLDFAAYRFMSLDQLRRHLPARDMDLCAEDGEVEYVVYQAILSEIIEAQRDPYLGMSYGMFLNLQALGLIHRISLEVTSIEQAILVLSDYLRSNFPFLRLHSTQVRHQMQLNLGTNMEDGPSSRFLLDSTYCFMFRELKVMGVKLMDLKIPYPDTGAYSHRLGQEIAEGDHYAFHFDYAQVNKQINPHTMQLIDALLPQYLLMLEREQGADFPTLVKRMLLQMSSPMLPTLAQVSAQFAMSDRNFQRKLHSYGESFRRITNEVKRQLAQYLQEGGQMKVKDIAYALGYSETSAYLHAVRNWKESHGSV